MVMTMVDHGCWLRGDSPGMVYIVLRRYWTRTQPPIQHQGRSKVIDAAISQLDALDGPLRLDGVPIVAPYLPRASLSVLAPIEIAHHIAQIRQHGAAHIDQPRRPRLDARARDVVQRVLDDEGVRREDRFGLGLSLGIGARRIPRAVPDGVLPPGHELLLVDALVDVLVAAGDEDQKAFLRARVGARAIALRLLRRHHVPAPREFAERAAEDVVAQVRREIVVRRR